MGQSATATAPADDAGGRSREQVQSPPASPAGSAPGASSSAGRDVPTTTGAPAPQGQGRLFPVRESWAHPLDRVTAVPPVFEGARVFLAFESGEVAAYDLSDGHEVWTAPARPVSSPALGEGLLFLVERESLVALDQETGAARWRLPFTEALAAPLVWDIGWLIGATTSGTVLAFRASDGVLIWRHDTGATLKASPALAADRVYVPLAGDEVLALKVDSGERLWSAHLGGAPTGMLALDDRIYVGSEDNFFYCLEADDGEIAWRWRTGADVVGIPVADRRLVYFVSLDNVLRGLDLRSGAQRWKRNLPFRPTRGPIRVGDLLLVSGLSTKVAAFSMRDGSPGGDLTAAGELAGPPYAGEVAGAPQIVVVTRDIAHGTRLAAFRRSPDADSRGGRGARPGAPAGAPGGRGNPAAPGGDPGTTAAPAGGPGATGAPPAPSGPASGRDAAPPPG